MADKKMRILHNTHCSTASEVSLVAQRLLYNVRGNEHNKSITASD